jgi:hypothetical protein
MKKYFVLLFLMAFQHCQEKSNLIIIQPDTKLENINLSQIGNKSSLVKLQTDTPLGEPSHILCSKNYIYFIQWGITGHAKKKNRSKNERIYKR